MTLQETQAILDRISYRKGWTFKYHNGSLISSRPLTEDVDKRVHLAPGDTFTLERPCAFDLDTITDAKCLIEIVYNEIKWLELHEMDEWFRVDGYLWNNPHAPGRNKAFDARLCGPLQPI